ncbi:hypothetical protein ABVT39_010994 [Epinephelus coioides]
MILCSGGASKDSAEIKFKENIKKEKSEKYTKGMVEKREIQQLFGELKDSLTKEFKELRVELKEFRQDTERDIKTIMQQTADLRNNLDLIVTRVNQLETRRQDSARPIIVALFDSDTKRRVLQAAWSKKEVNFKDTQIFYDHDFTFKVRQQRLLYKDVREQLKAQDIKTHILAPAKLKMFNKDGTTTTYPNPTTAIKELKEKGWMDGDSGRHPVETIWF